MNLDISPVQHQMQNWELGRTLCSFFLCTWFLLLLVLVGMKSKEIMK